MDTTKIIQLIILTKIIISFIFYPKFQSELDGLMRQHPHLVHSRQQHFINSGQKQLHSSSAHQLPPFQQAQLQPHHQPPHSHQRTIQIHPHSEHPTTTGVTPQQTGGMMMSGHHQTVPKRAMSNAGYLPKQRSFSSSEEELRSTPDFDGKSSFVKLRSSPIDTV